MKFLFLAAGLLLANLTYSQESLKTVQLDDVTVYSTRANEKTPTTYSTVNKKELTERNLGQDLPILLNFTPSLVTTSDAGAGIGYTGLRIRGSDATRINVTINGIPVNDSESHGVFWVNMPDLSSSLNSVQIQRGVGTSSNGAAAFGATVSLKTNNVSPEAFFQTDNTIGSFNTLKNNVTYNTGLMNGVYNFEARLSRITSDGFIDRSAADLKSYYLSGGRYGEKTMIKMVMFGGQEITQQAWYGTPEARLTGNADDIQELIDFGGEYSTPEQLDNLRNSGRSFNYYLYDNEVDNYRQDHYQLHVGHTISENFNFSGALHYTRGRGFFEQFRDSDEFGDYGLENIIFQRDTIFSDAFSEDSGYSNSSFGNNLENDPEILFNVLFDNNGDTIRDVGGNVLLEGIAQRSETDIIRRRWLDNHFYGATYSINYNKNEWDVTLGGAWNRYDGDHFGEIIWAEFANATNIRDRYYSGNGEKTDFNTFLKVNYQLNDELNLFGDAQIRKINYETSGLDNDREAYDVDTGFTFFNPKFGLTYSLNNSTNLYASYAIGNREPVRSDFIDANDGTEPKHETLKNIEIGVRSTSSNFSYEANFYHMNYENQLVVTGAVNDVGSPIRVNVPKSFRMGIELAGAYKFLDNLTWSANLTLSRNKIDQFSEIVFASFGEIQHANTDISFSPNVISASDLSYSPIDGLSLQLLTKYVGKQFLDNTSNDNRAIEAYLTNDVRIAYDFTFGDVKNIGISLLVNNVLDEEYSSNGYTWGYYYGDDQLYQQNNYYPQAGRNFLLAVSLKF
ncbi:TonB-dependent receptor [Ekhidna sp.]